MRELLEVQVDGWCEALQGVRDYLAGFDGRTPPALLRECERITDELARAGAPRQQAVNA